MNDPYKTPKSDTSPPPEVQGVATKPKSLVRPDNPATVAVWALIALLAAGAIYVQTRLGH